MVSSAAPEPISVTISWPYEVVPDPWCPVTIAGHTVGFVNAVHTSADGVEVELTITDHDSIRTFLDEKDPA